MDTASERNFIEEKEKILEEIEYRESVMLQLSFDTERRRCFFINFIQDVLKIKKIFPTSYFNYDNERIYNIDSDTELQKDIFKALEKSKNKLIEIYKSI